MEDMRSEDTKLLLDSARVCVRNCEGRGRCSDPQISSRDNWHSQRGVYLDEGRHITIDE